MALFLCLS